MSLFDKIFKPTAKQKNAAHADNLFKTLTAYKPVFTNWNGKIYESELIRAAIDAKARHISKLAIDIQGTAKPKLRNKMKNAPNPWQTYSQFLYRTSTILDVINTCCLVPIIGDNLETLGYFPVLPERCSLVEWKDNVYLKYKFRSGQTGAIEFDKCVVLTKHQYEDDFFGDKNSALDDTMKLIHLQQQGIKEAVKNSATYRFMAQVSNFTINEDLKLERERFTKENFVGEDANGLLLFPNTMTNIKQIRSTPYTIDNAQMEHIRTNVFNYFGVNEDIIQNKATSDKMDAFFNGAIEPFAIQLAEGLTKAAFSDLEQTNGNRFLVTANRLQYMSTNEKVAMAKELGDRGAIMIDEIRELFNFAPLPDGKGQRSPIRGEFYYVEEGKEYVQQ